MGSLVAIYDNYADTALFSGGSWLSNMPLTNLVDLDIGLVSRSTNLLAGSTQFNIDLGVLRVIGGIAIGPTNLSPGATYRITSYEDVGHTLLLYDSGTKIIEGTVVDSLDLEWENPGFWYGIEDLSALISPWVIEIVPIEDISDANAQYWKVEINDPNNSDGFVELGYMLMGRTFRPSLNFDENNSFGRTQLTDTIESLGGHRDYWHRGSRRRLRVTWWRLDEAEGWDDLYRMMTNLGVNLPLFVVPDPDDDSNLQKRSFLSTFVSTPELRLIIQDGVSTGFEVEEVL